MALQSEVWMDSAGDLRLSVPETWFQWGVKAERWRVQITAGRCCCTVQPQHWMLFIMCWFEENDSEVAIVPHCSITECNVHSLTANRAWQLVFLGLKASPLLLQTCILSLVFLQFPVHGELDPGWFLNIITTFLSFHSDRAGLLPDLGKGTWHQNNL